MKEVILRLCFIMIVVIIMIQAIFSIIILGKSSLTTTTTTSVKATYLPTWESLNSHKVPRWFDEAKFGIFIHWGIYSVPAWAPVGKYAEWYWHDMRQVGSPTWEYHVNNYGENFTYDDFIPMFTAEKYDPKEWVRIFKEAGARYIVITTKHHDGFCLWPSNYTHRDAGEMGPKRDLIGPLVKAARENGLKIGFYYSLLDWWHPSYPSEEYIQYAHNQVKELVQLYKPDILWLDGEWDYPSDFWKTKELVAWFYNNAEKPDEVCVNDRLGKETRRKYGDFFTFEYETMDEIADFKWELCRGIGYSFGYNRAEGPEDYLTAEEIVKLLVDVVSKNGNLLLNVGPKADGSLPEIQVERLLEVGQWLKINGEAIYGSHPWIIAGKGDIRFLQKNNTVYVITFKWPGKELVLDSLRASNKTKVRLLGLDEDLRWVQNENNFIIFMPEQKTGKYAYVFKIENVYPNILVINDVFLNNDVVKAGEPFTLLVSVTNPSPLEIRKNLTLELEIKWRGLIVKKVRENLEIILPAKGGVVHKIDLVINEPGTYEIFINSKFSRRIKVM
jgi:alpha-L-fucosidase